MTALEPDALASLRSALAPATVLVVARSALGGLVAVVILPPKERLQGSITRFLEGQLDSARATANGCGMSAAKASTKLRGLEWAVGRRKETTPTLARRVTVRVQGGPEEQLDVCEVTEMMLLVEKNDPLWVSVLLAGLFGSSIFFETASWGAVRKAAAAESDAFLVDQLLRRCARQAFGRCQMLQGKPGKKKKEKEKEPPPRMNAVEAVAQVKKSCPPHLTARQP